MTALVLREDRDGSAILTLNRPDKLNSLSVAVFTELLEHIERLEQATMNIGVVIIRGAGKCFSAGNDLSAIGSTPPKPDFQSHVVDRLASLPQPVVSAVHGFCYTGALELALAGDIILAAESAKFCDTHAKWAMSPHWGMSQRLPRRIGKAKALEMMLTSRVVSGPEAAVLGLANACYPDDSFDQAVEAFVTPILAGSFFTHRANKALVTETDGMTLRQGLAHEVFYSAGTGPDMQDRISAFARKSK